MTAKPWCCHLTDGVGCDQPAIFEIFAVREGGGFAGPAAHCDDTHACEDHVGALLTFQPDAVETGDIYWQVRTLAPVMLSA